MPPAGVVDLWRRQSLLSLSGSPRRQYTESDKSSLYIYDFTQDHWPNALRKALPCSWGPVKGSHTEGHPRSGYPSSILVLYLNNLYIRINLNLDMVISNFP